MGNYQFLNYTAKRGLEQKNLDNGAAIKILIKSIFTTGG